MSNPHEEDRASADKKGGDRTGIIGITGGLTADSAISYPDLEFDENTFTFIAGKSGCGKSTLLRMLNRTEVPAHGHVMYMDRDASSYPVLEYRKKVLLVPQEVFLFDGTIRNNFLRYADIRGTRPPSEPDMRSCLRVCGADFPLETDCGRLSVGERQRVFLSVFLSFRPSVLLLDEPTAALDETTAVKVLSSIKEHCRNDGTAVICVCHSEALIEGLADSVVRLEVSI